MSAGPLWAVLRPDTPFAGIFGDGRVPLVSPWPIRPRGADAPLCYLVAVAFLTPAQIAALAERLYALWQPKCASVAAATAYIRDPGLPLNVAWFELIAGAAIDLRYLV
jgi:hypothetical protein